MRPSSYPLLDELDSLAELLDESPEEVRVRELTALLTLLESADHRVVLFGAGTLGRRAFNGLDRRDLGGPVRAHHQPGEDPDSDDPCWK